MRSVVYVLVRPKMYTLSGSLGEVVAFVNGLTSGLSKSSSEALIVGEWVGFVDWLRVQLSVRQDHTDVFTVFANTYGNTEEAVLILKDYFDKYKAQL